MSIVAITGAGGYIGQQLIAYLENAAGIFNYIAYPWILDTKRAKQDLGWQPKHTSRVTQRIMLETHGYQRTRSVNHSKTVGPYAWRFFAFWFDIHWLYTYCS
jgi:nucleoside-diphosphate-sugar epimerase